MKTAFSLLELIVVVTIIGVLSAVIIPRSNPNTLYEAATQLISHIRYTQHLAIIDNKYKMDDASWYKKRWQINFGKSKYTHNLIAYSIFSDSATAHTANPNINEIAIDPNDPDKYLSGGYSGTLYTDDVRANKQMNLGLTYNITDVSLQAGCSGVRITFDQFGRPIKSSVITYKMLYKKNRALKKTCNIKLTDANNKSIIIYIEPETGYAHL